MKNNYKINMIFFRNFFYIFTIFLLFSVGFVFQTFGAGFSGQEIEKIKENKKSIKDSNSDIESSQRLIVKFKPEKINLKKNDGPHKSLDVAKNFKVKKIKDNLRYNFSVFEVDDVDKIEKIMDDLGKRNDVDYVEIDHRFTPYSISSNDLHRGYLWGLDNTGQGVNRGATGTIDADIDAPEAWQISTGTRREVVVGVIDSGTAFNHPDLIANMWDGSSCLDYNGDFLGGCQYGYDFASYDKIPLPYDSSHGTHVSGTIAAGLNNNYGVIGVAPNAKIMALATDLYTSEIVDALAFAEHNGADIINASWGGSFFSQTLYNAIASSSALFVAAAGNNGTDNSVSHKYPCDYDLDNILCVAATDNNDDLTSFSNYSIVTVDVAAPGNDIFSTMPFNVVYSEDFDGLVPPALPDNYIASGTWATASSSDPDWGVVLYADSNRFPYTASNTSYITSPTIDLSGLSTSTYTYFSYWLSCDTEYDPTNDVFLIYFSSNGTDFYLDDYWNEYWLDTDSATSGAAVYHFIEYTRIYNFQKTENFRFRFVWETDGDNNNFDGCFVDKIEIREIGDGSGNDYEYFSGTSMAAPHVAGAGAFIKGHNTYLTTNQLKYVLMNTGDAIPSLAGKVVSGRRLNIFNALSIFEPYVGYTVNNIIPVSQVSQRTNGSGIIDIGFRLKDGVDGLSATLSDFQYSFNNGIDWHAPTGTDASLSLSDNWEDDNYIFATDYSSTTYSFNFNTKSVDLIGLNDQDQGDIKIRFKGYDGATNTDWCVSESFSLDNLSPDIPSIASPTETMIVASSSVYFEGIATGSSFVYFKKATNTVASLAVSTSTNVFGGYVPLSEGDNSFYFFGVDDFGNQSASATSAIITRDLVGPSLSIFSIDSDISYPYVVASSAATATIIGEGGMFCRWSTSTSDTYSLMTNDCVVSSATSTCEFMINEGDGAKIFYVACLDSLNNENKLEVGLYRDLLGPVVDSVSISPNPNSSGTTTVSIIFQDVSDLDTSYSPTVWISGLITDPYTLTNSSFSTTTWTGYFILLDNDEVATGSIMMTGLRDVWGNVITATTTVGTIHVDSIPPGAPTLSGLPSNPTYNTGTSIIVGGTGIAYYKYKVDSGSYSSEISTTTLISLSGLAAGSHTVYVTGRDLAGNWQESSTNYTWEIQNAPSGGGGGGGGGGGSSVVRVVNDITEEEKVSIITTEETVNTYFSSDGTKIVYTYNDNYIGGFIDSVGVEADISKNDSYIDDLLIILDTDKVSQINSIKLQISSDLRRSWREEYGDIDILATLKTKKASSGQRTKEARRGLYILDYDVFYIELNQKENKVVNFSFPMFVSLEIGHIKDYENLKLYYFNLDSGTWEIVGRGGKIEDGWLHIGIYQKADFCLMYEGNERFLPFKINNDNSVISDHTLDVEKAMVKKIDNNLIEKLKGRILLQVEMNGEGWYVNPSDKKKYFLGRPKDAFNIMRNIGLGITNKDLQKIEVADINFEGYDFDDDGLSDMVEDSLGTNKNSNDSDGDGFGDRDELLRGYNPNGSGKLSIDKTFSDQLKGRIYLQVEAHGEAWYVNPLDKKRYFLGRPKDAFNIMRNLGLGITNENIRKIEVGEIR